MNTSLTTSQRLTGLWERAYWIKAISGAAGSIAADGKDNVDDAIALARCAEFLADELANSLDEIATELASTGCSAEPKLEAATR